MFADFTYNRLANYLHIISRICCSRRRRHTLVLMVELCMCTCMYNKQIRQAGHYDPSYTQCVSQQYSVVAGLPAGKVMQLAALTSSVVRDCSHCTNLMKIFATIISYIVGFKLFLATKYSKCISYDTNTVQFCHPILHKNHVIFMSMIKEVQTLSQELWTSTCGTI